MTPRRLTTFALSLAALGLSACSGLDLAERTAPAKPTAATVPQAEPVVAAPPPPRPVARPGTELSALRPAPRPTDGAASLNSAPPRLVGLSEEETVGLLGRPAEEAEQPPGKVWIYRAAGCQLSVHLFPDMEKGGYYTLDYAADGGRETCLGKVAGEARKRGDATAESAKAG